ncbi:hypothetical protein JCM24511_09643 [Saitozyma sp. JCM 24511]|nr:hypothetical protein JCM24511_09643 [Saitozyma sp. JCM 24511]
MTAVKPDFGAWRSPPPVDTPLVETHLGLAPSQSIACAALFLASTATTSPLPCRSEGVES